MTTERTLELLENGKSSKILEQMYGQEQVESSRERYVKLIKGFVQRYGTGEIEIFSAPGRTELGGNHTDHNNGKVLAGSINLDCVGIAARTSSNAVNIVSVDYNMDFQVDIENLESNEEDSTIKLVKGILAGFKKRGHCIGGLNAYITTNVISAAGVSSSASFEMLLCAMFDHLYNGGSVSTVEYAKIGQYAENKYWNKSSGLLDQMACAVGGIINIDFKDEENPVVNQIDIDFEKEGYGIVIVNTGKSHADLSEEYSRIPAEMKAVANYFGKKVCADITMDDIINHIGDLRREAGDRAILRAIHFINENDRVDDQVTALKNGAFDKFLKLIGESGDSSWKILQNCYSVDNYNEQGISLALTLTEMFLKHKKEGVCRVHGGGFAGVIMVILPKEDLSEYINYMETKFMQDSTYKMLIRKYGAINVSKVIEA